MSNDPGSQPPFQQGYFTDNPYATPNYGQPNGPGGFMPGQFPQGYGRRGLVNHVRIIAILNLVQGVLELILSAFMLFYLIMLNTMGDEIFPQDRPDSESAKTFLLVIAGGVGGLLLLTSVLRIWASISNFLFRGRALGITSMAIGLLSVFTFYCSITSIGIAVYGLIVLLNTEVAEAFEMRANGQSCDDILRNFNNRPA